MRVNKAYVDREAVNIRLSYADYSSRDSVYCIPHGIIMGGAIGLSAAPVTGRCDKLCRDFYPENV